MESTFLGVVSQMTRETQFDNAGDTSVLLPFEKSLVNVGKRTTNPVSIETQAEDELNFNQGREGLCLNGSSSFRIPYNPDTTLNWHNAWTICFWLKIDSAVTINQFPQILFNTLEVISTTAEQSITCSFIEPNKVRFSVNMVNRDSVDNSIELNKWHFIALTHIPNSKFEIHINNIDKLDTYANDGRITPAIIQSDNDVIFFKKYDNTNRASKAIKFYGFRFYQKELTIRERNILFGISQRDMAHPDGDYEDYIARTQVEAKSLASTFGGNVVKITKAISSKKVIVHGYIHELVNAEHLRSFTRRTLFQIVRALVDETDIEIRILGKFTDIYLKTATVSGSVFDLIRSYISNTNHRFFVNTAKQLVLQSNNLFDSRYTFTHGVNSLISETVQDSTNIRNEIITSEDGIVHDFTRTHAYNWDDWNRVRVFIRNAKFIKQITIRNNFNATSTSYTNIPFTASIVKSGVTFTYAAQLDDDYLLLKVVSSNLSTDVKLTIVVDIDYSIPTRTERKDQNERSVLRHGVRSKIIDKTSLGGVPYDDVVLQQLSLGNLRNSYRVESPQLLKHLRVGDYCVLNNPIINVSNVLVQVRKIQWLYPEGKTMLWCGDTKYDIYSTYAQIGEAIRNVLTINVNDIPIVPIDVDPNTLLDGNLYQ